MKESMCDTGLKKTGFYNEGKKMLWIDRWLWYNKDVIKGNHDENMYERQQCFMSIFSLVIICAIIESICNSIAGFSAVRRVHDISMKDTYFSTYNKLLIVAAVICFWIFSVNKIEHLYLATIAFYIYGLICEGIGMIILDWYLKIIKDDEK